MPYYTMLNGIEERVISFAKFLEISRKKIRICQKTRGKHCDALNYHLVSIK